MQKQNQDLTIEQLQNQIQQQQTAIQKLQNEQNKIAEYVEEFKAALKRKKQKQLIESAKRQEESQQKLQKQLLKEIETAKIKSKNYQHEYKNLVKKSKNICTSDDLLILEQQLKQKTTELKDTDQLIKDLKLSKRKLQKIIQNKEKTNGNQINKLTKLIEEVKRQKEILETLKSKNTPKEETLIKRKSQLKQLEKEYNEKCIKTGQKPMLFQDFKQRCKQKRKYQISLSRGKQKQKAQKKIITVKQMMTNQYQSENSCQITENSVNQLRTKKQIAQNSLKLAQKKSDKQIEQLRSRLQKLKDQNSMIEKRIEEKRKQKQQVAMQKNGQIVSQQLSRYGNFTKPKKPAPIISRNPTTTTTSTSGSHPTIKLQPLNKPAS